MDVNNFLDLKDILINELVGDTMLFVIVGIVLIWIVALRFKMPMEVAALMTAFFVLILGFTTNLLILKVLVVLAIAVIFYMMYARYLRRG